MEKKETTSVDLIMRHSAYIVAYGYSSSYYKKVNNSWINITQKVHTVPIHCKADYLCKVWAWHRFVCRQSEPVYTDEEEREG